MAQFTELPSETLFMIMEYLSVEDVENLRSTCKILFVITEDASLWRRALCSLLSLPLSWVMATVRSATVQQLRRRAKKAVLMTERWHYDRPMPRHVRSYTWDKLQDVQLIPGGEWMVCLFSEGTLQVRRVETMELACSAPSLTDASMFNMSCTSVTPEGNFYALFHCTDRIHIYELHLTPVKQNIRHASLAGNVLAFDCYYEGRDLVYMRKVHTDEDDSVMHAAIVHEQTHCTIHVLSVNVVLLCNSHGISVYKSSGLVGRTQSSVLDIVSSETVWSTTFDSWSSGQLSGSPAIWDKLYGGHQGPLMILGPGVMHIVQPSRDLRHYSLRSFRVPQVVAQAPAVGTRFALCVQTEEGRGLVFKTCTFPRVLQEYDEILEAEALQVSPEEVRLGSFVIDEVKDMSPVLTRLDEWTGCACVLLEDDRGQKRLVIVDVV